MDDKTEQVVMNSRIREGFMKYYEFPILRKFLQNHHIRLTNQSVLDAGCGCGYSTHLINHTFHPSKLVAFDIVPEQIQLAAKRNRQATVFVGDITHLDLPDASFDAVFTLGILHHLDDPTAGLREINRLLKPHGVLLGSEPRSLHGFIWEAFTTDLAATGLQLLDSQKIYFSFFVNFMCQKN